MLLREILSLSRQMLRHASDDEWELLQQAEQRRSRLIGTCFPVKTPLADPRATAELVRQIIETGDMVTELVINARDRAGKALGKLKQGRSATRAYRQIG